MSTLAYAILTTKREEVSGSSKSVTRYVDAVSALVPAEVLSMHGVILAITMKTTQDGKTITEITDPITLAWAFWGLLILSMVLYVVPRFSGWDRRDWIRVLIPPVAFVVWTMLQRSTAFDAVCPELGDAPRTVIALFGAVVLGVFATLLAKKADKKDPAAAGKTNS